MDSGDRSKTPPVTYIINSHLQTVFLTYHRNPRLEEWEKIMQEIFRHPEFRSNFNFLSDRRAVAASSTEFVHAAIKFLKKQKMEGIWAGRWAVVVGNLVSYGMARMAQSIIDDANIDYRIFTDFDEAQKWLISSR